MTFLWNCSIQTNCGHTPNSFCAHLYAPRWLSYVLFTMFLIFLYHILILNIFCITSLIFQWHSRLIFRPLEISKNEFIWLHFHSYAILFRNKITLLLNTTYYYYLLTLILLLILFDWLYYTFYVITQFFVIFKIILCVKCSCNINRIKQWQMFYSQTLISSKCNNNWIQLIHNRLIARNRSLLNGCLNTLLSKLIWYIKIEKSYII